MVETSLEHSGTSPFTDRSAKKVKPFMHPQQNLWACFGSGSRPMLCSRATFAISAARTPSDFLVPSFTLFAEAHHGPLGTEPVQDEAT
jgi:hypothetical protein